MIAAMEAMEAVETGESGINRAAVDHGVPKTTLKNRLSGRVKHGKKPGPECYLNEEEKELRSIICKILCLYWLMFCYFLLTFPYFNNS